LRRAPECLFVLAREWMLKLDPVRAAFIKERKARLMLRPVLNATIGEIM